MWSPQKSIFACARIKFSSQLAMLLIASLILTSPALSSGVSGEGIKVHGDWVIIVTNPDGSIAQERAIQNALHSGGKEQLIGLLAGERKLAFWGDDTPFWSLLVDTTGVVENLSCPDSVISTKVKAAVSNVSVVNFTLVRSFSLPSDCITNTSYAIDAVKSRLVTTTFSGPVITTYSSVFSEKILSSPIAGILPDQVVTLKVTFSFE